MLIAFTLFKTFISKLITFCVANWRIILIALICLYAFMQKTRYEAVVVEFEAYKANIAYQADMRKIENEILRKQALASKTEIVAIHTQQLADANLDRKRETDKLKGAINEVSNELNIYRNAIKLRNEFTSGIDLSTLAENTSGTAKPTGNCNETLATVVNACLVTDIDYETLYKLYQKQCDIFGCE